MPTVLVRTADVRNAALTGWFAPVTFVAFGASFSLLVLVWTASVSDDLSNSGAFIMGGWFVATIVRALHQRRVQDKREPSEASPPAPRP